MTKLHELLAVEKSKISATHKLYEETLSKFKKEQFFSGHLKRLNMLIDSPENVAIERAAKDDKALPTTVPETLKYFLDFWANSEDVTYAKNQTNQAANADLLLDGEVLVANVPVDELLGLEVRLENLRRLMNEMPTLDAAKTWAKTNSGRFGEWVALTDEVTSKTEKVMTPVVLYEATDKHPAQIERVTVDKVVGSFTRTSFSGAATSKQKATVIELLDKLLYEAKQARQRANCVEASKEKICHVLTDLLMGAFNV
jgi:hypothetical protein